jgi:hypothetical protein
MIKKKGKRQEQYINQTKKCNDNVKKQHESS